MTAGNQFIVAKPIDGWLEGFTLHHLETLGSTNDEAARLALEGAPSGTVVLADRQTEGRGRLGRRWQSKPGNLHASLVLRPNCSLQAASQLSLLAAVALVELLAERAPSDLDLKLKWPNDVLIDGGKVAGILLESVGTAQALDWLAIGVGVNRVSAPPDVRDAAFPPIGLEEAGGTPCDRHEFLSLLASNMATEESLFQRLGFGPIRKNWLRRAARLGEIITARTAREEFTGRFETIDEAGQLVLETPKGQVRIPAADVYF